MAVSRTPTRLLACCTVALVLFAGIPCALADSLTDAEDDLAAGKRDAARAALGAWLDAGEARGEQLLRAAQVARKLPDLGLLGRVRAAAETLEQEETSPALDLALGFAYLGLAEENLRLRTNSQSISLYFADAGARAERVPADSPHADLATRLAAAARYAQGDLQGAVKRLETFLASAKAPSPELLALYGRLVYERGATLPLLQTGQPQPSARADFQAAVDALGKAVAADVLTEAQVRSARLRMAWSLHRLGRIGEAVVQYQAGYATATKDGTYVLRGLRSLLARDPARLLHVLGELARAHPGDTALLDALGAVQVEQKQLGAALLTAHARLEAAPQDAEGWRRVGDVLFAAGNRPGAVRHYARALEIDPTLLAAAGGMERAAQQAGATDIEAALAIYERLMKLRPEDPYCRNNLGFMLREYITKFAPIGDHELQKIRLDAPKRAHELLRRCVDVYAEAVALIDPKLDGTRDPMLAWNLAGIVNDYALMLQYFVDVQDPPHARRLYLRAMRMTDYGFRDTYVPNLHRLFTYLIKDDPWTWYSVAREAQNAIMKEVPDQGGRMTLVPDEEKRAVARRDVAAARARIMQVLEKNARADGLPWPPAKETGNDR